MSEATTWAAAQRVPDRSAQHVLEKLARWAQADNCVWLKVEIIAFEMGCTERTVFRAIEYLLAMPDARIERTERKHLHQGKLFPVYQLRLDRGPKNTAEAMRMAREAAGCDALLLTPVSPQAESSPDTGVTPRDDTGDALPLTPVTPHHLKDELELEIKPEAGAREAAFEGLFVAWSAAAPHRVSRPRDRAAFEAACEAGAEPADVLAAARRCLAEDPDIRAGRVMALERWLTEQRFEGWATASAAPAVTAPCGWAGPAEVWAAVVAARDLAFAVSYLDKSGWADGAIRPWSHRAWVELAALKRAGALGDDVRVAEFQTSGAR